MTQSLRKQKFEELIYILGLTVGIGLLTPLILGILTEAWEQEGLFHQTIWQIGYLFGETDIVFIFPVAMYLGLLLIFSLDRMKKPQAAMLGLGTIIAGLYLFSEGLLIQQVDWAGQYGIFIIGLGFGALIGGGYKLRTWNWPYEFRTAPNLILLFLGIVIAAALVEIHLINEPPYFATPTGLESNTNFQFWQLNLVDLIPNLTFSAIYLFIVDKFTQYEYKEDFMVLGPKRGGKTTLMTGSFITADSMTESNARASEKLYNFMYELRTSKGGFGNVDEPTAAGDFYQLWFDYDYGRWLKKNVRVEAIDHGGEVLLDLKYEIDKVTEETLWDNRPKPFKRFVEIINQITSELRAFRGDSNKYTTEDISTTDASRFRSEAHEAVARSVTKADSLVVTIPLIDYVEDNVSEENLPEYYDASDTDVAKRPDRVEYLTEYDNILSWFTDQGGKEVIVVTTMSDLLLKEFEEQKLNGTKVTTEEEHRRFERWLVTDVMGQEISRIMDYSNSETPLALYFQMNDEPYVTEEGNKEPNPVLEDNSVRFVNGERLLRKLAS